MWLAGDKHARYLRRQAWTLTAPFARDQIPRLVVISLPFVVCVTLAHLQVIPFGELERVSKIKRAPGPPKTGGFCICFAAVKIKAGVSGLSE